MSPLSTKNSSGAGLNLSLSDGNLTTATDGTANQTARGSFSVSSGKWYFETTVPSANGTTSQASGVGVAAPHIGGVDGSSGPGYAIIYRETGGVFLGNGTSRSDPAAGTHATYVAGDIIGVALDIDNGDVEFFKNGVSAATYNFPAHAVSGTNWTIESLMRQADSVVVHNFGQNPTFTHTKAVFGKRVNTGNADSIWHQSSNSGTHTDWTISADGTNLQVSVSAGAYARAYLLASDGTIDPKKRYLVTFDYVTGPANLGVAASNSGGSIEYLTALDGSVSPNGLSSGNSYAFEFQGDQFAFTGFQLSTYELDNVIISEIGNTYTDDSGRGKFSYQPPTGFLALCEDNLPTPAIADPGKYFKTVLYTGDGINGRSITGVGFTPDLVWVKERSNTSPHELIDSVRGAGYYINSNTTNAENFSDQMVKSFDNDGFSIGNAGAHNQDGETYVAWCWQAGGAAVSNTDGTITSQVSANQTAGFSIATWTGNALTSQTIGHGLGKTPDFYIWKSRDNARNWHCAHTGLTAYNYTLYLDTTGGEVNNDKLYAAPTSTVISPSQSNTINGNGEDYVGYFWTEIEAFSKFGSYVGNGNVDGPFVYCGFKPAFVLWKNASNATGYNWYISDNTRSSTNPVGSTLAPNTSNIEDNGWGAGIMDFTSNGFKIRRSPADTNTSGDTYIFAAFAESPFQTANAK